MKKIIIAALSTLLITGAAMAQTEKVQHQQKHGQHNKHSKGKMGHHLNLSDEQKKQAKTIGESYHQQVEALKKNDNLSMGEYKKQMASLQKDRKAKMQALLTTEQKAKIAEGRKKGEDHAQV